MAIYKTVPFAEFLADAVSHSSKRNYAGFISKDGRLASLGGVSYDASGFGLNVKYNDGSVSRNKFDGTALNILMSHGEEIDRSNNDLYAIYVVETE